MTQTACSPFFSVVIPSYNREKSIEATLDSVARQKFRDFECIVVDDGSTDKTCQLAQRYPFVRLIQQDNTGPGAARNTGIQASAGAYVAFLDSDDIWFPWTLQHYFNVIKLTGEICLGSKR